MTEPMALDAKALEAVDAVAEVFWTDFHGRMGGPWPGIRNIEYISVAQTVATAKAAIRAYLAAIPPPAAGTGLEPVAVNPAAYTADQLARLAFAVHYSTLFCAPQNIASFIKEIDCCPGCEHISSSGSMCYKSERGDYCPGDICNDLREVSAALYGTPGLGGYREAVWGPGAPSSLIPATPAARAAVLEAAAKVADEYADTWAKIGARTAESNAPSVRVGAGREIAAAIRALKEKT